jgi:gluconokinase
LQWLKEKIFQANETYEQFLKLAENVDPGSNGLLFLPYILGERSPIWDSNAKGMFFGLTIDHTKAHFVRAAAEGIIYALFSIGKILIEKNEIAEIYAGGGFAQNELWIQMLADVFNKKVTVSNTIESSAFGAVITGMEALNLRIFDLKKSGSVFLPDLAKHEMYLNHFKKFERLYHLVKNGMSFDV